MTNDPMRYGAQVDPQAAFQEVPTDLPEPDLSPEVVEALRTADTLFDQLCEERYKAGRDKYGHLTFLSMPTIQMAQEEIIDLANYARFTFVKLELLKLQIQAIQESSMKDGFYSTDSVTKMRKPI